MDQHVERADVQVRLLYENLVLGWNSYNAEEFAKLFTPDGNLIGFDGSQINGRVAIKAHLMDVFRDHQPPSMVSIIEEVRRIGSEAFVLRAVTGMLHAGDDDIDPNLNAVHTVVAQKDEDKFCITLFQTTPAAFHQRADLREKLTADLREALLDLKRDHQFAAES